MAGAFEGKAGGLPGVESALEGLDVRVAGGAEFFRGGGGVERTFTRAVNDKRRGWVEAERLDVIEKGRLIDARVQ